MKQRKQCGKICKSKALALVLACFCVAQLCCVMAWADEEQVQYVLPMDGAFDGAVMQAHGTYTVAYSEDYSPFSYVDSSGNAAGMAISIMDWIAQIADIDVEYVSVDEADRYNLDVDINLAILDEDQIDTVNVRSVPYTSLQMMAVSPAPQLETQGAIVGHLPYHYLEDGIIEQELQGCLVYTYFTYAEMSKAYEDQQIDYMLVTSLVAGQLAETTQQTQIYVVPTNAYLEFFFSYSENLSPEIQDNFDQLLRSLDSDYVYSLMLSSVIAASDNGDMTIWDVLETYAVPILSALLLLWAAVAGFVIKTNRSKRKFLEQTLYVDELTGLMTERKFLLAVEETLANQPAETNFIITIDIDNFKGINEMYGYDVGTKVIVVFGDVLKSIFPSSAYIARFFADEFVVLYSTEQQGLYVQDIEAYGQYIAKAMVDLLGETYRFTTSCGIYQIKDPHVPVSYMIDCSNVARELGKKTYGISQMMFTDDLEQKLHQKNEIIRTMENALEEKEFQIHYQPKISLETGALVGAEALVRWIRPDGQKRYPDAFIPLFESNGFISKVDYFVLESVCDFLRRNPQLPKISVNFSGNSMLADDLVEQVMSITQAYGIAPHRLEIEITESAVVQNFEAIVKQTAKLKKKGFTISMDDFGAGVSSLNRLAELNIDVVKIDKAFLKERNLSQRSVSIIAHIVAMAKDLGILTVAEGVEYPQQEALLKELGCDIAQGYYHAKPQPEMDYLEFLRTFDGPVARPL